MLKLEQITKSFNDHQVLRGIDLEVSKGDLIYIQGINGSGKSTLFKIICDIIDPDQGTVSLTEGEQVGALIENPGFVEGENLRFNLEALGSINNCYNEEYVKELCQRLQLDYFGKQPVKNYSVGMRQKLGIIQALMEDQDLILFDEPSRGLDKESAREFIQIIQELHERKDKLIIIASHEYIDLPYTRQLLLEDGLITRVKDLEQSNVDLSLSAD